MTPHRLEAARRLAHARSIDVVAGLLAEVERERAAAAAWLRASADAADKLGQGLTATMLRAEACAFERGAHVRALSTDTGDKA